MTNENRGLSCEEAQKRLYAGYGNVQVKNESKSVGQIIAGNIFTYFNFIFAVFTALIWRVSMKNRKSDCFSKKKTLRLMPQGKLFINVSSDSF